MRLVARAQIGIGVGVVIWWTVAGLTGIPEVEKGRVDIWFHIVAELTMAGLLIAAGSAQMVRGRSSGGVVLAGMALGALLYSSINSPGYFAERGEWWGVAMFGVIAAFTIALAVSTRDMSGAGDPLMRRTRSPRGTVGKMTTVPRGSDQSSNTP